MWLQDIVNMTGCPHPNSLTLPKLIKNELVEKANGRTHEDFAKEMHVKFGQYVRDKEDVSCKKFFFSLSVKVHCPIN